MARIRIYTNSFVASVLSVCGYTLAMIGFIVAFTESIAGGVIIALIGLVLGVMGAKVSENKQFRVWKRKIESDGISNLIKEDVKVAVMAYNSNPSKKTLAYISQLNPIAGELITEKIRSSKN